MFVTAISSSILVLLKLGESSHVTENIIIFFFLTSMSAKWHDWSCICLIGCKFLPFLPRVTQISWTNGQIMYAWLFTRENFRCQFLQCGIIGTKCDQENNDTKVDKCQWTFGYTATPDTAFIAPVVFRFISLLCLFYRVFRITYFSHTANWKKLFVKCCQEDTQLFPISLLKSLSMII